MRLGCGVGWGGVGWGGGRGAEADITGGGGVAPPRTNKIKTKPCAEQLFIFVWLETSQLPWRAIW